MAELTSNEIIRLLEVLVGSTEPIGETNYDSKVVDNLKTVIDIGNWCLDRVLTARKNIEKSEWSMHDVGFRAQCCLQEWSQWLIDREKEWENNDSL